MVYVLDKNGQPLMPTRNHTKVRILLKTGKAKVVRRCPFTVQLGYETAGHTQPVSLGVDAGSRHIGISAATKERVLFEADVALRDDITKLLSTRRQSRQSRRNRKTRYRKPRFNNRKKPDKWLAPSIKQKIECHLAVIKKVHEILPVKKIVVETASFDTQKLKADMENLERPEGTDYQQGEQSGFWNVREYVLFRDGHICQCCMGKSKDKILNVHHIESRKTGGNAPNNLITLCETCHRGHHAGTVKLPDEIKRGMTFKDAAFMGIMRWAFYDRLKEIYPDVHMTYGYITKNTRISHRLSEKSGLSDDKHYPLNHVIDARCISGNPDAVSNGTVYYLKKIRRHNRQAYKSNTLKGGIRKKNQAPYNVKGYRLFDTVQYKKELYTIYGRRSSGFFDIRKLDGTKVNNGSISYKKLRLVSISRSFITEIKAIA